MSRSTAGIDLVHLHLPSGYVARAAVEADRDAYVELSIATLLVYAQQLYGLSEAEVRPGMHDEFEPCHSWVVESEHGDVAGIFVVERRIEDLWIDHMVVDPAHQGHGIGTSVVDWVQRTARRLGLPVTLSVVDGNPARVLYERMGFTADGGAPPRTRLRWTPPVRVGVGVAVLVTRGEELLLLRRRHVHGDGTWSTPGGHVDHGEKLEQTAVREVLEETGLEVANPRFVGVTNDVMPADGKHYVTVWMRCDYTDGEPVIGDAHEMDAVCWRPFDDLPAPLFIPLANLVSGQALGGADLWPPAS